MNKFNEFLVNYQGFYKVFRKMPVIIFWLVFVACTIAGIVIAADYGEFGEFLGGIFAGAIGGFILAVLHAIAISPIIIITDSKLEKK